MAKGKRSRRSKKNRKNRGEDSARYSATLIISRQVLAEALGLSDMLKTIWPSMLKGKVRLAL